MGYVIRMPQLGMSMDEGTIVEWLFDEGGAVEAGEVVAIVESEKTSAEVEAREGGSLGAILVGEGANVEPGAPIGVLLGPGEDLDAYADELEGAIETTHVERREPPEGEPAVDAPSARAESNEAVDRSTDVQATPGARQRAEEAGVALAEVDGTGPQGVVTEDDVERRIQSAASAEDVRSTPGARRLAEDRGVDLAEVDGTGPQGVVTEDDVRAHASRAGGSDREAAARTVTETRGLSNVQRTVSDRLSRSYREAVHVTLQRDFDAAALESATEAAAAAGLAGSTTDLLIKAAGEALSAHPEFNATFEDGEHRLVDEVNIGVAVEVDDGLVTPVVPDVERKSVEAVNEVRRALAERVRSGAFTADDLVGGTFTISNLGPYGVDHFDPIINPPEVAILGVGRIRDDGTMGLSLSFDHRVVNGADAARLLDDLVGVLTDGAVLAGLYDGDVQVEAGRPTPRDVTVESTASFSGTYATGVGSVAFDEPEALGGTGSAPSPVDHLLGAIGACLTLSVRAMAGRDDVEVGAITAEVTGIPEEGPLSAVTVRLSMETDAPEDVLERTVTKAERSCYVARSLSDDLDVSVDWQRR